MGFVKVIQSDQLPPPREAPGGFAMPAIRRVNLGGRDVLVTRLGSGEAVAFDTHCPHQGTPLERAVLIGDQLRCAQHNFVYDPSTGHNVRPTLGAGPDALFRLKPGYLPTFKVEEKEGWVWVSDSPNPPPSGPPPRPVPPPSRHIPPMPGPPAAKVDEALDAKEVSAGDTFDLEISAKPEPGHIWRLEPASVIVTLAGQVFDEEQGLYRLRLNAQKPGSETVTLIFGKPWGGHQKEMRTVELTVR